MKEAFPEVSIHSGHCWPENTATIGGTSANGFQSTPAIAGRRTLHRGRQLRIVGVSIHSGHCWPENRGEQACGGYRSVSIHSGHCWPENAAHRRLDGVRNRVSIHSGHCWPENKVLWLNSVSFSFQSTPAIAGRRTPLLLPPPRPIRFQSTPAIAGRRTTEPHSVWSVWKLFQSTPAIAGRRTVEGPVSKNSAVFQSTPAIAGRRTDRFDCRRP